MVKRVCDKCGNEIEVDGAFWVLTLNKAKNLGETFSIEDHKDSVQMDICTDCFNEVLAKVKREDIQ